MSGQKSSHSQASLFHILMLINRCSSSVNSIVDVEALVWDVIVVKLALVVDGILVGHLQSLIGNNLVFHFA